jgi:3,4-dihydroxy 2-butanone 4-phosphate synthase / GTP cyclohydrolase II
MSRPCSMNNREGRVSGGAGVGSTGSIGRRLDDVAVAVQALRRGVPVLVVDDPDRENEGDVVMAAAHATPGWVAWTVRQTSGVLCAPMPATYADRLGLPPMVVDNQDPRRTAYTVSVDARHGIGTGIGAADRARTLRLLAEEGTGPDDLVRPGHVFPLRARPGGVLERAGHTEAAVDLCRLAGLPPVGVIAEVIADSGEPMRLPGLRGLAGSAGLPLISISDLAQHLAERLRGETADGEPTLATTSIAPAPVARLAETTIPTRHGRLRALGYRDRRTGQECVALVAGEPPRRGALVRVHSECLTGDALGSLRCDCGPQLDAALALVCAQDGVVVYVRGHEGRGIGLMPKLAAYALQDTGLDTVTANTAQGLPVDARDYAAAAAVLADLGLDDLRLLTNNPAKVAGLTRHGIRVRERVALQAGHGPDNHAYLRAKRDLLGHLVLPGDPGRLAAR